MNNLKLLLKNIKNYGLKNIILIILFEGIYSLNFKFRKHIFYDESCTDSYENVKLKRGENENFKTSRILYDTCGKSALGASWHANIKPIK